MNAVAAAVCLTVAVLSACAPPAGVAVTEQPRPVSPATSPEPLDTPDPTLATRSSPTAAPIVELVPDENGVASVDLEAEWTKLIAGDDAMWAVVHRASRRAMVRIDPETNEVTTVVPELPMFPNPTHGMAVNGSIWVSSFDMGTVTRYDATTGEELGTLSVGVHPIEPVMAHGDVWILNHGESSITRIDTANGEVAATIEVPAGPLVLDPGGGLLWVSAPTTPLVAAIDPKTNHVVRTIELEPECQPIASWFGDRVWVAGCPGGVQIFDPDTGERIGDSNLGMPGSALRLEAGDRVWTAKPGQAEVTLVALDATTREVVDEFHTGLTVPQPDIVAAFDSLWAYGESGQVVRVPLSTLEE